MKRALRWFDYITINIYWLGLTTLSQSNGLIFPLLVQSFVGEETKGTFYGKLRLWSLMTALLVQALMGMLSDRNPSRWGRRRPFIFIGTVADLIFVACIGLIAGFSGMGGYWLLFLLAILLQLSSNTAHGAQQGLIPDVVPEGYRGRFSGVKAFLELPVPLILVAFTIGPLIKGGNLWAALFVVMGVLAVTMFLTMLVPEKPLEKPPDPINWNPFIRLLLMTGVFTVVILGIGWLVRLTEQLVDAVSSTTAAVICMGIIGLIGMSIAIGIGVWISVRASVGTSARKSPSFTWWVINRLAFLVPANNLSTFAVFFLQGRLGYEREAAAGPASQLMMLVGIFILVMALPSGWLADRFGRKGLVVVSGVTAALGVLIALLAPNLTLIFVGGCFIGAATGIFFTANWALGTDLVPKEQAGRYLGISNLAGAGAGAVGAYIGGPIADYFTIRAPEVAGLGYVLLFAIFGVLFLLSSIALIGVRPGGAKISST